MKKMRIFEILRVLGVLEVEQQANLDSTGGVMRQALDAAAGE
jgi:hypothetical protein